MRTAARRLSALATTFGSVGTKVVDHARRRVVRRRLRNVATPAVPSNRSALVLAPHPDDETLGCGGIVAAKRAAGVAVTIVIVTDGSACYEGADPAVPLAPDDVAALRETEATAAVGHLGIDPDDLHFLGLRDGGLAHLDDRHHRIVVERLRRIIDEERPEEIYVPHAADVHPDHLAVRELALEAVAASSLAPTVWQYLIWSLWAVDHLDPFRAAGCPGLHAVDVADTLEAKRSALGEYHSQFEPMYGHQAVPRRMRPYFDHPWEYVALEGATIRSRVRSTPRAAAARARATAVEWIGSSRRRGSALPALPRA